MVVINVSKNINSLFMGEYILILFKLTLNIHFLSLFNCKTSIVICHMFFDTLRIINTLRIFFVESYHACLNITRTRFFFFGNTWKKG
jgi:hypothetical protein